MEGMESSEVRRRSHSYIRCPNRPALVPRTFPVQCSPIPYRLGDLPASLLSGHRALNPQQPTSISRVPSRRRLPIWRPSGGEPTRAVLKRTHSTSMVGWSVRGGGEDAARDRHCFPVYGVSSAGDRGCVAEKEVLVGWIASWSCRLGVLEVSREGLWFRVRWVPCWEELCCVGLLACPRGSRS